MPFVPANSSRTQQLKRQQNNRCNGKKMKYLVQISVVKLFMKHSISTCTEWRLHMICTCSGLKQEVKAAVVGHLVEEPVCSNSRWSVSLFYQFYLTSLHGQWCVVQFVHQAPCFLCFSVSAVSFWCFELGKHKAQQSSKTPKLDSPVAQCGDRCNMRADDERVA